MNRAARLGAALILSLLAGCGGAGDWAKAGGDEAAASREYEDCRALAGGAVQTDADIDQDILATRQSDWQRAGVVRQQTRVMHEQTRDRAAAIIESCMKAKGYSQKR
jgi:hypothetical protein